MSHTSSSIALAPAKAVRESFLDGVQIEFGPTQLLGRFFAEGDKLLRAKGIELTMGTLEDAVETQSLNGASWHSFPPMLDPRLCKAGPKDSYCFIGRDALGNVVTAQAGRILGGSDTLLAWLDSGRFVYGDSLPGAHFRFEVSAPSAAAIRSPFVYSGALWVHPSHRGAKLAGILVRLSRAYALAHWGTNYTVTFVSDVIRNSPMPQIYGYSKIEPGVAAHDLPDGSEWRGHFLWMDRTELIDDLSRYLADRLTKIDTAVLNRAADQDA